MNFWFSASSQKSLTLVHHENSQLKVVNTYYSDDIAQIEPNFKPKFLHLDCLHLSHLRLLLLLRTLFLASAHALAL